MLCPEEFINRMISLTSELGWGFPGGSVVKNPPANAGDVDSIPGLGRSPGEGNGNWNCLENPMDRGAWRLQKNQT